jgi:hypothetical protein
MATWTTLGATTDFAAADGPNAGEESMYRETFADSGVGRIAVLSTSATNCEVGVAVYVSHNSNPVLTDSPHASVVARYVNTTNYLALQLSATALTLTGQVAGATITLGSMTIARAAGKWYRLRLVVFSSGQAIGSLLDAATGAELATVTAADSRLATGGALATGNPGFIDFNPEADVSASGGENPARYFDNFYMSIPPAEPIVVYPGRSIQFRHDSVLRQDSTGTYSGPPPAYVGGPL